MYRNRQLFCFANLEREVRSRELIADRTSSKNAINSRGLAFPLLIFTGNRGIWKKTVCFETNTSINNSNGHDGSFLTPYS